MKERLDSIPRDLLSASAETQKRRKPLWAMILFTFRCKEAKKTYSEFRFAARALGKSLLLIVVYYLSTVAAGIAGVSDAPSSNTVTQMSQADIEWRKLDEIDLNSGTSFRAVRAAIEKCGNNTQAFAAWGERVRLEYRETGLRLWARYPSDERRYWWLIDTISEAGAPAYWKDIESGAEACVKHQRAAIDEARRTCWDEQAIALCAEAIALAPETAREELQVGSVKHWWEELCASPNRVTNTELDAFFMEVVYDLRSWKFKGHGAGADSLLGALFYTAPAGMGYTFLDTRASLRSAFIRGIGFTSNPDIKEWAMVYGHIDDLYTKPMELRAPIIGAKGQLKLSELRGKVVLIDIFGYPGCSACIDWLPRLQAIYEKYRDQGFVILGAGIITPHPAHSVADREAEWLKILQRATVTYPNCDVGPAKGEFATRYGIYSVPRELLLDRSGRLVTIKPEGSSDTIELQAQRLDETIGGLLKEKVSQYNE